MNSEQAVEKIEKTLEEMLATHYSSAPQRTPEWYEIRRGKVTASRLEDWMAVSKAKKTEGQPLKARLDYEKELMYERQFNVSYNNYITDAMQDGIDLEDFAAQQYANLTGCSLAEVGCWYNDFFVASPDRAVFMDDDTSDVQNAIGLLEIKVVRDNTFAEILISGVPAKHWKQIQGQLWASGQDWCDYVAVNLNTKKFAVIRVERDQEFIDYLVESVQEQLVVAKFETTKIHDIVGEVPSWDNGLEDKVKETSKW